MKYPDMVTEPAGEPDSELFDRQRAEVFNASMTAVLFGAHPFETAADYWVSKHTGSKVEKNDAMVRGQMLEPSLANWFATEIGRPVYKSEGFYRRGHIGASLDYVAGDSDIVEIKTTAKLDVDEPLEYWLWQVQAQMLVTGMEKAYIVWMDGRLTLQWTEVDADEHMQENIWHESSAFMESLKVGEIPEKYDTEAKHVIAMFPDPEEEGTEAGDAGMTLVENYWGHRQAAKYHEDEAGKVRDLLFTMAGNTSSIQCEGKTIATLRPRKLAAQFHKSRFKEDHPDLYDEYMGEPTTTRALNIPAKTKKAIEGEN